MRGRLPERYLGERMEKSALGVENRMFKGPAARGEQYLKKERALVWLDTGQQGEGESGGPAEESC